MLFAFYAQWLTDSFLRTDLRDPRKNHSNHELDLCQIYGLGPTQSDALRKKCDGLLRFQVLDEKTGGEPGGGEFPPFLFDQARIKRDWEGFANDPVSFIHADFIHLHSTERLQAVVRNVKPEMLQYYFATGLEHGNSSIGQLILNTIWMREHNRIARMLVQTCNLEDDDEIFEKTRNINILQHLRVIIRDYIRHISTLDIALDIVPGMAERQRWYRENWITIEFNLLYRWHSMVPEKFRIDDKDYDPEDFTRNTKLLRDYGLEKLITAASRQTTGRIGLQNTHKMFFEPFNVDGETRESVMVRSVKMGRDVDLGRYNDYRKAFGLKTKKQFKDLTGDNSSDERELSKKLSDLYAGPNGIDRLEWHVGVFAEKPEEGGIFGELMTRMVAYDAFTHALTNPLLSEQVYGDETFTKLGRLYAESTDTLGQVIRRNVTKPTCVTASFTVPRDVPGSYGLPVIGVILDTIDFMFISGWRRFFEKRARLLNSSVFKASNLMRSIVVLDKRGMDPFINWADGPLKKTFGFGPVAPPRRLTGNVTPSVFTDGDIHDSYKSLYMEILERNYSRLPSTFQTVISDHAPNWETKTARPMRKAIEDFAADFVFQWYLNCSANAKDVRKVYLSMFKFKPFLWIIDLLGLHGGKKEYRRLEELVRSSAEFAAYCDMADKLELKDRDEVLHQLLFVMGVNSFLGLQNFAKSIWAELSNNPEVAETVRSALKNRRCGHRVKTNLDDLRLSDELGNFLLEVLRKHPPVFFIFGTAKEDFCLETSTGFYHIERDDHLTAAIPMAQIDPEVYGDPDVFRPDRYSNGARPSDLVWPHASHTASIQREGHGCPGRDYAIDFGRLFCRFLLLDCEWQMEPQTWDEKRYSLNVAAPMGEMKVREFRVI